MKFGDKKSMEDFVRSIPDVEGFSREGHVCDCEFCNRSKEPSIVCKVCQTVHNKIEEALKKGECRSCGNIFKDNSERKRKLLSYKL